MTTSAKMMEELTRDVVGKSLSLHSFQERQEKVRRDFWPTLRRFAGQVPFVEDLVAASARLCGYVASSSQPLPTSSFARVPVLWLGFRRYQDLAASPMMQPCSPPYSVSHRTSLPCNRAAAAKAL